MTNIRRRELLAGTALVLMGETVARATTVTGGLPWKPNAGSPPPIIDREAWRFFSAAEVAMLEAVADRIIPPDAETPGGKEAGCVVFIDGQLAGAYGDSAGLYHAGPFVEGSKNQGPQSATTPNQSYRQALAALDAHCQTHEQRAFVALTGEQQDALLRQLEEGTLALNGVDGKDFFTMLLKDMQEGFFSDPVYGGNREMCGWKMIGYPGAHYDYRDWVSRHNERYPYPPVSIAGRPDWTPKKA